MQESAIEARLVREVERIGGLAPKWVSPGNNGVTDRLIILPGGVTVYVETKRPGEPLRPLQRKWRKELLKRGHRHYKIDNYEDIDRFIREVTAGQPYTDEEWKKYESYYAGLLAGEDLEV